MELPPLLSRLVLLFLLLILFLSSFPSSKATTTTTTTKRTTQNRMPGFVFTRTRGKCTPQARQKEVNMKSVSIASIFPPYSSNTESETSSASNESSPRFSCSIDTLFPPARSPSQSPPRFSFSIETFFPPARSPSQSDSSGNYEEIFPIDPFISKCSRRTLRALQKVVTRVRINNGKKNAWSRAMQIVFGVQGVESACLKGKDSSQVVVGIDIVSVHLTSLLRKKIGHAELISHHSIMRGKNNESPNTVDSVNC